MPFSMQISDFFYVLSIEIIQFVFAIQVVWE